MSFYFGDYSYENFRRVVYGKGEFEGATFVPVCLICRQFVKADEMMRFQGDTIAAGPNATCSKCGRIEMPFEGFIG